MLTDWLTGYGPSNLGVLVMLVAVGVLIGAGYWWQRRRWQQALQGLQTALNEARWQGEQLQHELAEAQRQHSLDEAQHRVAVDEARAHYDPVRFRELHDHLQRVIAHEFNKGLDFIRSECEEMATGLRGDQIDLRRRIKGVEEKSHDMIHHAMNILELPNLKRDAVQRTPVSLHRLLQEVLKELLTYAETRGVELKAKFGSLEPIFVSKPLVVLMCRNVIHNAIKYSPKDRDEVVDIALYLDSEDAPQAIVDVRDRGRGIEIKDQESIFELNERGDGLLEPGSGLGLHLARTIAQLHGGDVVLVESTRDGSLFRIILPYDAPTEPQGEST